MSRTIKCIVIVVTLSIIYLYLPDSLRTKVVEISPHLDKTFALAGFHPTLITDSLPVWGKEITIPCSDKLWKKLCISAPKSKQTVLLNNTGFTVGYSEKFCDPLWVKYRLFNVDSFSRGKRPSHFSADPRTSVQVTHDDYTGSGYDRGHMAPNFGIATRYDRKGQLATFYMSNIIPQTPGVNRNVWKHIEMLNAKNYGRYLGEVLVITGPVFGKNPAKLSNKVCVPDAYYKIVLNRTNGEVRALAFLIPANSWSIRRLNTTLVSIDFIERLTGIDFLTPLSHKNEKLLEADAATHIWFSLPDQIKYYYARIKNLI